MGVITKEHFNQVNQDQYGPAQIVANLSSIPELFSFLQKKSRILQKARPMVVFAIAATVHAFYHSSYQSPRELPPGVFDAIWEKFSYEEFRQELPDFVQDLEPEAWNFFLNLVQAAYTKEEWSEQELAVASLVYGTVLTALIMMFWPEEDLYQVEDAIYGLG